LHDALPIWFDAPARPIRRQQHTQLATPISAGFWPRWVILRHDPGLAASPPARYMLRVDRSRSLLSLDRLLRTDNLLAKRRRVGRYVGPGGSPVRRTLS